MKKILFILCIALVSCGSNDNQNKESEVKSFYKIEQFDCNGKVINVWITSDLGKRYDLPGTSFRDAEGKYVFITGTIKITEINL